MTNLKEYIDFTMSLKDMEEVKSGVFPLPKEIIFTLNSIEHAALQTQIHDAKGLPKEEYVHQEVYTIDILGIEFTFKVQD